MVVPYSVLISDDFRVAEYFGDLAIRRIFEKFIKKYKGNQEAISDLKMVLEKRKDGKYEVIYSELQKELSGYEASSN